MIDIFSLSKKYSLTLIFIFLTITNICFAHLIPCMCELIHGKSYCNIQQFENKDSLILIFFVSVILAPLIETFIAQFLVIECCFLFSKNRNINYISMILSSIIFAMGHFSYNNVWIIFDTLISGIILSFIYIEWRGRTKNPFLATVLFHSIYNLYAFMISDFIPKIL